MAGSGKVLDGLTVVDRAQGMSSALTAKLLAELGAAVVREISAEAEPFAHIYAADAAWRAGEVRVAGADECDSGMAGADVCILGGEDLPGIVRTTGAADYCARYPRLVALEISAYPKGSPYEGRPGADILAQATSGLAAELFPDRPALLAFNPSLYGAALRGVAGVLAALIERETSGRGQAVYTSLYEGALIWGSFFWFDSERPRQPLPPKGVRPLIFRCRDGKFIHLAFASRGSAGRAYRVLGIDDPSVVEDVGHAKYGSTQDDYFGNIDLIAAHVALFQSDELIAALREAEVAVDPVQAPGDCWSDAQTAINDIIVAGADGTRHVGNPIQLELEPAQHDRPSLAREDAPLGRAMILDLGQHLATPFGARLLAELGARVVKVEPLSVSSTSIRYIANAGKDSIKLDLKSARGMEIFHRLCARSQLVMSNFRAGVTARLGIDAAALHRAFPGIAVVESPGYGVEGPRAHEPTFDMALQAACGHEARAGGAGNPPLWNRTAMVDVCAAMLNAIAGLAGLYHRARTGGASVARVPLFNAGIYLLSELVQSASGDFAGASTVNARQSGTHPAEAFYETSDGWLAVAALDDASARRLVETLGIDDRLTRARAAWDDSELREIARAFASLSCAQALRLLDDRGVWAERCVGIGRSNFLDDAYHQSVGIVTRGWHAKLGRTAQIGRLLRFSRSTAQAELVGVDPGENTDSILQELGFDPEAIAQLHVDGIVA